MGQEAVVEADMEDEELAAHEAAGLHDLEQKTSDESDESYAPPPPREHDAEAGGSQQAPPPPPPASAEASSIATLTRLFEEQ